MWTCCGYYMQNTNLGRIQPQKLVQQGFTLTHLTSSLLNSQFPHMKISKQFSNKLKKKKRKPSKFYKYLLQFCKIHHQLHNLFS
ncbi:unnamed protein product [Citrullus colocynthis]|uniref:Uncharacterized protein n=1 Tax=Citrullus colocynthis TaxID=252529 RepID=A0ABP0ZAJ5_9ROSI